MKSLLLSTVLILHLIKLDAQSNGINWEKYTSWKEVLKVSRENKRPIFLDVYATWCGPCKWMDQEVYINDSVGEFFNREFINIKVQMDSLEWDAPEIKAWYSSIPEIKNAYPVTAFPTLLFLSYNGEVYKKIEGVRDAPSLINEAKDALDPKKQYSTKMKAYQEGYRDPFFVRDLTRLTEWGGEKVKARKMAQEYIASLSQKEMLTKDNIWFIYDFTKRSTDPGFAFLRDQGKNIEQVEEKMATKYTDSKVKMIIRYEAIEPYRKDNNGRANWALINQSLKPYGKAGQITLEWLMPDIKFNDEFREFLDTKPDWETIKKEVAKYKFNRTGTLRMYEMIAWYYNGLYHSKKLADNKTFITAVTFYFDQPDAYLDGGLDNLANEFSWAAFGLSKDKDVLTAALKWSQRAMRDRPNEAGPIDTYANLLYKLERKDEALEWEKKAIEKNAFDEDIKANYEKMKRGEKTWDDKH